MSKSFKIWGELKAKLDAKDLKAPQVSEGQVWWVSLGENIGMEINGKSAVFSRPALIFKKLSKTFYTVVPLTTQHKEGSWFVSYDYGGKKVTACLHQIRAVDYRRLNSRLGELKQKDFHKIKEAFRKLYG